MDFIRKYIICFYYLQRGKKIDLLQHVFVCYELQLYLGISVDWCKKTLQNCPVYGAIIIINDEEIFINNEEKIYKNIFEQAHMKKQCMRIHLKLVTLNIAQRLKEI